MIQLVPFRSQTYISSKDLRYIMVDNPQASLKLTNFHLGFGEMLIDLHK